MKNIFIVLLITGLGICSCQKPKVKPNPPYPSEGNNGTTEKSIYDEVIDNQISFILSAQLPEGPIMDTAVPGSRINPYFANIACRALLVKPTAAHISAVKKYMAWYISKLNGTSNPVTGGAEIAGSIYDYAGAAQTTNGTYDSVDSYAATFLSLAHDLAALSAEDKAWVKGLSTQIALVASALEKCIDTEANQMPTTFGADDNDGLSVDSYVHGAKYLMDNAEVNEGLKDMVWLQKNVFGADATNWQTLLDKNTAAFESQLWRGGMYNWYDNGSTGVTISKWDTFYADGVGQLFPAMLGVIDPQSARASDLYSQFNAHYPDWAKGTVYSGAYPFALVSYAAAVVKDKSRVDSYITHILSFNRAGKQKDYWYNAEAAFVILAANKAKSL